MHIIATSTKEDLIQLGTFFDSLNEVIHEYTSPYKDSDAFVRIVKPPPIVGWMALGNIGDKQKSFVVNNGMVEVTCEGNKMLVASINKIHSRNLKIEECCSQEQEKLLKYYKMWNVEVN